MKYYPARVVGYRRAVNDLGAVHPEVTAHLPGCVADARRRRPPSISASPFLPGAGTGSIVQHEADPFGRRNEAPRPVSISDALGTNRSHVGLACIAATRGDQPARPSTHPLPPEQLGRCGGRNIDSPEHRGCT